MRSLASLLLVPFFLAGCDTGYTHLVLEPLAEPLAGTVLEPIFLRRIVLPVGTAVGIRAIPMAGDEELEEAPTVLLESCDPGILEVEDGPDRNDFVLVGRAPGRTCVRVEVTGEERSELPALVTRR